MANKIRRPQDFEGLNEFCGRHSFELVGRLPWSEQVVVADQERMPVIDWPAAADYVKAVQAVAASLLGETDVPAGATAGTEA